MAKKKVKEATDPELTYRDAQARLERIVASVENEELDVDELSEQVQQAMKLIAYCRSKLKQTEETIQQAFDGEN